MSYRLLGAVPIRTRAATALDWSGSKGLTDATMPSFEKNVITDTADYAYSVYAVDVNNDGYMDVLSASELDDTIAWYKALRTAA